MTSHEKRALRTENTRLRSAMSAVHNHLHADDVNAAHEACEQALMCGETVTQPNISADDGARAMSFAAEFNSLAARYDLRACCVLVLPSTTVPNAVSLQLLGEVTACKIVETQIRGASSTYMGDHSERVKAAEVSDAR